MGKKYTYDFYYKISEDAQNDGGAYLKYSYDRDLPLNNKEYNIAATKLIDSVANDLDISKDYVTTVTEEVFLKNQKNKDIQTK